MQLKWTNALAVTALVAGAAIASAQNPSTSGTYLGLEAGAYFPSDSTIRTIFGSSLPRIGVSFINNSQPEQMKPSFSFSVIGANKDGNRFLCIPVTVGMGKQYGGEGKTGIRPYWRAGAGAAYFDYSIDPGNTGSPTAAHKIGFTAVGEVGMLVTDRIRISASYNYFSKQDNFDFSGFDLKISFLFWKI